MKRIFIEGIAISYIFSFSLLGQDAQEGSPFSMQESIRHALENNPAVQNASLDRNIRTLKNRAITAALLPQIEGDVNYTYNLAVQTSFLPDFISPTVYDILEEEKLLDPAPRTYGIVPAQFGTDHGASLGITIKQKAFDASIWIALKARRLSEALTGKDYEKAIIDLVEVVMKAYFLVLIAEKQLVLSEQSEQRLRTLLLETQALYRNGFAEKVDVDRLQVNLGLSEVETQRIRDQLTISRQVLNLHMGLPLPTLLILSDSLEEASFESLLLRTDFAVEQRVEEQQITLAEQLAELDVKDQFAKFLPTIDLNSSFGYSMGANSFGALFDSENRFGYGSVGVKMKIPIFQGLRRTSDYARKKIELQQIENQHTEINENLRLDYTRSKTKLAANVQLLQKQKQNLSLARELYRASRAKYQQGLGSNLEALDAARTLKEVETTYYNALYEALVAKTEHEKALGILWNQF